MQNNNNPPKWSQVYPQGTKEGDEEQALFISLSRHPKYDWRSVPHLATESHLTEERAEEILFKYYKKGMVFQKPDNDIYWCYWERVPDMVPKKHKSISQTDKEKRISMYRN